MRNAGEQLKVCTGLELSVSARIPHPPLRDTLSPGEGIAWYIIGALNDNLLYHKNQYGLPGIHCPGRFFYEILLYYLPFRHTGSKRGENPAADGSRMYPSENTKMDGRTRVRLQFEASPFGCDPGLWNASGKGCGIPKGVPAGGR